MNGMGAHSHPNGHRGEDGAAAVATLEHDEPLWLPWTARPEPRMESVSEELVGAAVRRIDGDTAIRLLAGAVVLAVAAFAAIVSYSHIFELGSHHGQDGTAARLLPLSVDGLIAAASLVMLHAARNKMGVPWLARAMLALGVGATVAANVGYGLPFGWLSAVVSAWPAVAFVGSVEMATRFVRDARHIATADEEVAAPDDATDNDSAGDKMDDSDPPLPPPPGPPDKRPRQPSGRAKAVAIMKRNPGLSDAEVAKRAKVSERTVQRARAGLNGAKP